MSDAGKSASVRQRLLNRAKSSGDDYNQLLTRYAGLRFLARLSASSYSEEFFLKGATMFLVWNGSLHRPTADIDLLGFVDRDGESLKEVVKLVCQQAVEGDGLRFDQESVRVIRIRDEMALGGFRCMVGATLGSAKVQVHLDVGFGDVVIPGPVLVPIPRLLGDEIERTIQAYTPESMIAEKVHVIVHLGLANSRMKDYFDIDQLIQGGGVTPEVLGSAIRATFLQRGTPLPSEIPMGLTSAYWDNELVQRRWRAFVTKNGLETDSLMEICNRISATLLSSLATPSG